MTTIPRPTTDSLHKAVADKVAVVSGAARGIGFATAGLLARSGAKTVLVDLSEGILKQACSTIGLQTTYRVCDVSSWNQQAKMFQWVQEKYGSIDILVCNAAVNPEIAPQRVSDPERKVQMNEQVYYNYLADQRTSTEGNAPLEKPSTQLFDINVNSVVYGLKLGVHYMKKNGGRIVVTGSAGSYLPIPSQPLYAASKHAVLGLVRSTSCMPEVVASGVTISLVAPWLTLTSMVEGLKEATNPDTLKSSPEDVAWAIAFAAAGSKEQSHGKGFWIQGSTITEVESSYWEVTERLMSPENRF
ncbi:hypothetical protein N7463_000885 [Penicillium fimorum]|uniref:Uncharacterized protein n=1 Tax=Penicillium fimorum TaxID=1882269 RepID=A0A9W9Y6Z7_9EURO|nr:hypothetical protein N7463_000885 [Penicillium fimorum]